MRYLSAHLGGFYLSNSTFLYLSKHDVRCVRLQQHLATVRHHIQPHHLLNSLLSVRMRRRPLIVATSDMYFRRQ